eukprot:TRINITY_DN37721_c0_g2_i1.p1 TRINITY_DN37721_c0_g2~~TRINITY_DN37721_c0_g2_i1.p1  ORF type:complete len:418 (-),score=82.49 TRINITY_DN37721_c0_g2_i1:109-1362(-)
MLGIAAYDSDDEDDGAAVKDACGAVSSVCGVGSLLPVGITAEVSSVTSAADMGAAVTPASFVRDELCSLGAQESATAASAAGAPGNNKSSFTGGSTGGKATGKVTKPPRRCAEIQREVMAARSATAVVQVVRRWLECIELRWGAEALYQIAKRSTARTRKEWSRDSDVQKLAKMLICEVEMEVSLSNRAEHVALLLVAMDALRRMEMQTKDAQRPTIERVFQGVVADEWRHPVKSLCRLYWLAAPLNMQEVCSLPRELRERVPTFDSLDVALVVQAMRQKGSHEAVLLQKVVSRLSQHGAHEGLSATDLVEMAEALKELGHHDEAALRPLGMEVLRRRGELTPDESHRVHASFDSLKLPLPQVWTKPGSARKREGSSIVTTTTFVPQDGHEKKRRGNHDVERTSPPRVVRDYKMMSY